MAANTQRKRKDPYMAGLKFNSIGFEQTRIYVGICKHWNYWLQTSQTRDHLHRYALFSIFCPIQMHQSQNVLRGSPKWQTVKLVWDCLCTCRGLFTNLYSLLVMLNHSLTSSRLCLGKTISVHLTIVEKNLSIPGLFFFIFVFSAVTVKHVDYKILPMTGFELRHLVLEDTNH